MLPGEQEAMFQDKNLGAAQSMHTRSGSFGLSVCAVTGAAQLILKHTVLNPNSSTLTGLGSVLERLT